MRTGRKKKCGRTKIRGCAFSAPGRRISDASYDINRDSHLKGITNPGFLKLHELGRIRHQIFSLDMNVELSFVSYRDGTCRDRQSENLMAKIQPCLKLRDSNRDAGPIISCRPSHLRLMSIRLSVRPILRIRTAKPSQILPHRIMSTDATASTSPHPVEDSIRQKVSSPPLGGS